MKICVIGATLLAKQLVSFFRYKTMMFFITVLTRAQAIRCIDSDVKYVVFIDADFTYPAGYLPEMVRILEENPEVGMVTGNRFNHSFELRAMKSPYFVGNRFLALAQRFLNGVRLGIL